MATLRMSLLRSVAKFPSPREANMPHMIDQTTGRDAIAFVGQTPWHGLGHELTAGASIKEWTKEAGLDWDVLRSPVLFHDARNFDGPIPGDYSAIQRYLDCEVLYRSDTGAPLGTASSDYKLVQPKDVMGFFDDLVKIGKFQLETAGALSGGKRIWALAKINDGAPIIGQDIVRPYLLLTTSYDSSLATTAKLTAIRVVCHNTLSVSLRGENEAVDEPVKTIVKVHHSMQFNACDVRMQLGIFENAFEQWMIQTRLLAEQDISLDIAAEMALDIVREIPIRVRGPGPVPMRLDESVAYRRIMELFEGQAIGSDLSEGLTKWQFINSVTQWIDHERGRTIDGRLNSAWFGAGDALKNKAYALAMK